jgi:hypothetical protein
MAGQQFQRDATPEPRVLGQINLPHATLAEEIENPIVAESLPSYKRGLVRQSLKPDGGRFEEDSCGLVGGNEGIDFTAQMLIAHARFGKEGGTLCGSRSSAPWKSLSMCRQRSGFIA